MKTNQNIYYTLILLGFALFAQAQQSTTTLTPGYWTFGINGGWAYQSSDIKAQFNGFGVGATLGKNLYYRPGAPLAFDLRGRLLFTQQYGLDALRSYNITNNTAVNGSGSLNYLTYPNELQEPRGFIFANHKTTTAELALEGLLTLNQLRERTGVHVGLFGGIGLDWFRAKTDQADFSGKEYFEGYASLKDNQPTSLIRRELETILDGNYETVADGNNTGGSVKFMPSLGVELGYQITPRFLIYGGHRVTFSGTDILDGQQFKNANQDLYHYTNFGLRWIIDPQKDEPLARKPEIELIAPFGSPYTTNSAVVTVIADIRNVNSAADVECLVNGRSVPFDYKNGRFSVNADLNIGNNDVIIIARNEAGQARRNVMIVYKNQIIDQPIVKAPVIRIINPTYNNYRTEEANFIIKAIIENVQSAQEVVFTVNNVDRSFDLNNINFSANITLREGENEIEIRARNSAGIDAQAITIIREVRVALPKVEITEPNAIRTETRFSTVSITANIYNIENKSDINLAVNGRPVYNFDYDISRSIITSNINLEKGANTVVITARNRAGEARDEATIVYQEPITQRYPPTVRIIEPYNNSEIVTTFAEVRARVENIRNNRDINLIVNGRPVYDFNYNINAQTLSARVNLIEGNNTVTIRAVNADGTDEQTINVRYRRNLNLPAITVLAPVNNSETKDASIDLRARVDNISNRNNINIRLNNVPFYDFDYNPSTRQLTAKVGLYEGNNTIEINARNEDGSAVGTVNVRYRKVELPVVQITNPINNSETTEADVMIRATIKNINDKNKIRLTLNGKVVSNFNFDRNRQEVSATVTLLEGNNTIRLEANNEAGKAEDNINIRYRRPQAPTVSILEPGNNLNVKDATITLRARIETWNRRYTIKVLLNGNEIKNYEYKGNELAAPLTLREGNNTIHIQVANTDGKAEAAVNVRYERLKQPPTITFITPENGAKLKNNQVMVKAMITNMSSARGIIFKVNEKIVQEFDFKGENFTANVNLEPGNNVLTLNAQNEDGKAEATIQVTTLALVIGKPVSLLPSVIFTQPKTSGTVISEKTFKFVANIRNISSKEEARIWVNGEAWSDFDWNARSREIALILDLKAGKNIVKIEGKNAVGTGEAETFVIFQPETVAVKPVIDIVSFSQVASNPFKRNEGNSTLLARVENVEAKNQLKIWLNNQEISDFRFDLVSKEIEADLTLQRGANMLKIQASNAAGTSELTKQIDY